MNRREENITPNFSPSNQPLEFEFLPVKNPPVKKETIIMMIFKIDKKLPDKISKKFNRVMKKLLIKIINAIIPIFLLINFKYAIRSPN